MTLHDGFPSKIGKKNKEGLKKSKPESTALRENPKTLKKLTSEKNCVRST